MRRLREVLADSADRLNSLETKMDAVWQESKLNDLLSDLQDDGFEIDETKDIDSLAKTYKRKVKIKKGWKNTYDISVHMNAEGEFTYEGTSQSYKKNLGGWPECKSYASLADMQVHIGQWLLENQEEFQRHDRMMADIKREKEEKKRPLFQRILSFGQ